jgi:FKBP-type peptidyl-prolyl cis-trans isomerase
VWATPVCPPILVSLVPTPPFVHRLRGGLWERPEVRTSDANRLGWVRPNKCRRPAGTNEVPPSVIACTSLPCETIRHNSKTQTRYLHDFLTTVSSAQVKFDSSLERNTPLVFKHGSGRLVPGIEDGVHEMRVGGERRVEIPKRLGYNPVSKARLCVVE